MKQENPAARLESPAFRRGEEVKIPSGPPRRPRWLSFVLIGVLQFVLLLAFLGAAYWLLSELAP